MSENIQTNENSRFNTGNQVSVTTSMMTIWDSTTGAQLKISILNNGLGIAIWLPFVNPDGSRKYPSENRHSVVLNQKNAFALEKVITDNIISAYEKGNNNHSGVFTNNARSNMIELEVRDGNFYLLIHRNCDPVTRIPKDTVRFKFESTNIIDNYDSVSGEMNIVPIQADFFVFAKAVCAYNDLVGGTIAAHGSSIANVSFNQRFMDYIRSIADAVHAQLPAPTYQNNGYRAQNTNNGVRQGYSSDATNNIPQVVTTEVNTLSDLIG